MQAELILENGMHFRGSAFGHMKEARGEVIFTTRTFGYQEFLTDPSLAGKIVVFAYPLIGNYGFNLEDLESSKVHAKGIVVRQSCDYPSNFRCEMDIAGFLKQNKVIGLEGIDTRKLTKTLVTEGSMKGILTVRADALYQTQIQKNLETISDYGLVNEVSTEKVKVIDGTGIKIALIDLGVTRSEIELLKENNCHITIFPAFTTADEIKKASPDALYISGGPMEASVLQAIAVTAKTFFGVIPIIGTGVGALAIAKGEGSKIKRLKIGHYSSNAPIKSLINNRVYMVSQSIGYTMESLPKSFKATHINISDQTIEGFSDEKRKIYGISFLPERQKAQTENIIKSFVSIVRGTENA